MGKTPEQIRGDLASFAGQLRKLSFPTSPIQVDLAMFVADALERYLHDGTPGISLDAAFGLAPRRGRPPDIERTLEMATRIYALKLEGKSWMAITEAINSAHGPQLGEREIRRIFETHQHTVRAEEMSRRWLADDENG